jgi:hypothetical protein
MATQVVVVVAAAGLLLLPPPPPFGGKSFFPPSVYQIAILFHNIDTHLLAQHPTKFHPNRNLRIIKRKVPFSLVRFCLNFVE